MKLYNLIKVLIITIVIINLVESKLKVNKKPKETFKLSVGQRSGRNLLFYKACKQATIYTTTERKKQTKFPCPDSTGVDCYSCKLESGKPSVNCFFPISLGNSQCYARTSSRLFAHDAFKNVSVEKSAKVDLQLSDPNKTFYILDNSISMKGVSDDALDESIKAIEDNKDYGSLKNFCFFNGHNEIVNKFGNEKKLHLTYLSTKLGVNECLKALLSSGEESNITTIHIITDGFDSNETEFEAEFTTSKILNVEILFDITEPKKAISSWLKQMKNTTPGTFSVNSEIIKYRP